jgi:hypothetical protein
LKYRAVGSPQRDDREIGGWVAGPGIAQPAAGGPQQWSFGSTAEPVVIAPIIVGSVAVLGTAKGVYALSLADGTMLSFSALNVFAGSNDLAGMAAADGRLFVPSGTKVVSF